MPQRWLGCLAISIFSFAVGIGDCCALPLIDQGLVLQICRAFLNNKPEQMPAIVTADARIALFERYHKLSKLLGGCISASPRDPRAVPNGDALRRFSTEVAIGRFSSKSIFFLEHPHYDTLWSFSMDDTSINHHRSTRYGRAGCRSRHLCSRDAGGSESRERPDTLRIVERQSFSSLKTTCRKHSASRRRAYVRADCSRVSHHHRCERNWGRFVWFKSQHVRHN
jgi:hypothetical protein